MRRWEIEATILNFHSSCVDNDAAVKFWIDAEDFHSMERKGSKVSNDLGLDIISSVEIEMET